jgi:hypothetical protein
MNGKGKLTFKATIDEEVFLGKFLRKRIHPGKKMKSGPAYLK